MQHLLQTACHTSSYPPAQNRKKTCTILDPAGRCYDAQTTQPHTRYICTAKCRPLEYTSLDRETSRLLHKHFLDPIAMCQRYEARYRFKYNSVNTQLPSETVLLRQRHETDIKIDSMGMVEKVRSFCDQIQTQATQIPDSAACTHVPD